MLKLYNTLTREKEEVKPLENNEIRMYACGPTVYDYAHIGNLRTYIFEDLLKRALLMNGYAVRHVINITDVGHLTSDEDEGEDKMTRALKREGKPMTLEAMREVANFYADAFKQDIAKLNILPPNIWCFASEHISEQIALIKRLEEKSYAYKISDGIYFDTAKLKDYGKLAGAGFQKEDESAQRIINPEKKNPRDFALWKFSEDKALGWDSPWGKGFPGWHIECSAMSMKYLGDTFDIHCGGIDHIPVHHTNEIAQSEAATGKIPAVLWAHGNFLRTALGKRMGKSEGNLLTIKELEDGGYSPLDYRYLTLTAHYRSPLSFSFEALNSARAARERLNNIVLNLFENAVSKASKNTADSFKKEFTDAVNNDLNMPQAVAVLWKYAPSLDLNSFLWADKVLGLGLDKIKPVEVPPEIQELASKREEARKVKNWAESDIIREKLAEKGWIVEDMPEGARLKRAR